MSRLMLLLAGFASAFAFAGAIENGTQGDDDDHQLTSVDLSTSVDLLTSVDHFGAPTTIPPPPPTTAHNEGIVFGDEKVCNNPADIVFVLDESGSIFGPHFTQQLDFVQKTIESFDIGFNRTHVGVLTFASTERVIFPLAKYTDKEELKNAVKEIKQMRGDTYTHLALKRLREEMFSKKYARSWVPHITIVITDGESNYPRETVKEAQLCHQEDMQVFAIGVGTAVVKTELEAIASRPDMVHSVGSYAALEELQLILVADCRDCDSVSDLIFVLDESASINARSFTQLLQFVTNIVDSFEVGVNHTRVGVMTYAREPRVIYNLTQSQTKESVKDAIRLIQQAGGVSKTDSALLKLYELMSASGGPRGRGSRQVAVVITDSKSTDDKETKAKARRVQLLSNVTVIAIGVGHQVDYKELTEIARSIDDRVFTVDDYRVLGTISNAVLRKACGWISSVITSTFSSSESVSTTLDAVESTTSEDPGQQQSSTNWYLISLSLVAALSLLLIIIGVLVVAFCRRLKKKLSAKYASAVSGNLEMPIRNGDYDIEPYATSDPYETIDDASAVSGKLEMPFRDGDYDIQPYATSDNYETAIDADLKVFVAPRQGPLPTPGYSGLTNTDPTAPTVYTSSIDTYEIPVDVTLGSRDMEVLAILETTSDKQVDCSEGEKDGEGEGNQSSVHPYMELFDDIVADDNPEGHMSTSDFDIPSSYLTVNL